MAKQNENDRKKATDPASAKQAAGSSVPHARGGGQTDSATGGKPGGGGNLPSAKK